MKEHILAKFFYEDAFAVIKHIGSPDNTSKQQAEYFSHTL